ncbi:MAG: site-2 protease family protein, partial [Planctomycetota bacterium]
FSLGFGPRVAGFSWKETDVRLSALPLGGYVRLAGYNPERPDAPDPRNLFRVHWYNGADRRSLVPVPSHLVLPPELTGVPATALHSGDRWWHCGADTMAQLDSRALAAVGAAAAAYLYFIANAGAAEAQWLGAESLADWDERLAREAAGWWERLSAAQVSARPVVLRDALARLDFLGVVGGKTALSPLRLAPSAERKTVRHALAQLAQHARRRVNLEKRRLRQAAGAGVVPAAPAVRTAGVSPAPAGGTPALPGAGGTPAAQPEQSVPVRKFRGMLCYDTIPRARREGRSSPMWNAPLMRALMWSDGRRSLAEVLRLGALDSGLPEQAILDEILFLSRNGLIEWH